MTDLDMVAFDIETTGLDAAATVTVVGFDLPLGVRVFCRTGGHAVDGVEATVRERVDSHVVVSTHASEVALLNALDAFVEGRLRPEDVFLGAFNGETWRGGFDVPFLRSRCVVQEIAWPFRGLAYADLLPVLTDRFNTVVDGDTRTDLGGVYEVLCEGDLNGRDPFADSEQAVTAFEDGHLTDVVVHNVVDVLRTGALGRVAERYCSKSDFSLKSLTPVEHD